MNLPSGRVLSVTASLALVEVDAMPICQRCAAGRGCGAGLIAPQESVRTVEATIADTLRPVPGDRVNIELSAANVLRAAMLTYGLPLLLMLAAVMGGWLFTADLSDGLAIILAAVGLLLGFAISATWLRHGACLQEFVPRIVAVCAPGSLETDQAAQL